MGLQGTTLEHENSLGCNIPESLLHRKKDLPESWTKMIIAVRGGQAASV